MPRGKRLKTKKKEAKGLIEARLDAVRKWYKKHPSEHLKDFAKQIASNTAAKDVLNIGIALTFTPIIKSVIDSDESLRSIQVRMQKEAFLPGAGSPFGYIFAIIDEATGFRKMRGGESPQIEGLFPDWFDWAVAFGISYLLVTNFKSVIEVFGNVLNLAKAVMGVAVSG